jgi:hypothetical protein
MELLVSVVDKGPGHEHIKAGHVIDVRPDGAVWTPREIGHHDWRIIRCDIPEEEAFALMTPGDYVHLAGSVEPVRVSMHHRKFRLALDFSDHPIVGTKDIHPDVFRKAVKAVKS